MLNSPWFWRLNQAACLLIYAFATWLFIQGHPKHILVWFAAVVLAAHILEVPIAFRKLGRHELPAYHVMLCTILFGLTWWFPAERGVLSSDKP